jgi:serine/threonine protein kinase
MGCLVTTSSNLTFSPGTVLKGKWNGQKYSVVQILGEGANGKVYLVRQRKSIYALKVGFQTLDLQSEVNVLQALSKSKGEQSPFLIDVDDVQVQGEDIPFYVMQYIKGYRIQDYVDKHGADWLYLIGTNLLKQLSELHRYGWVFGDLKLENIIVTDYGRVELIDYGGTTPIGKSVKQFTEIYDRGYWNCGSRSADQGYDLFSIAVLFIMLCDSKKRLSSSMQLLPQHREAEYLISIIEESHALQPLKFVLKNMILQNYSTTEKALEDWKRSLFKVHRLPRLAAPPVKWLGGVFAASMMGFAAALYLVMQ